VRIGLRRIIIAGAGLSALSLLLWYRLDLPDMNAYIDRQTSKLANTGVSIENSQLTFLHGVGLRLDKVSLERTGFHMQADHIIVGVHLLPLLLGKIEISNLDIHDGTFSLSPSALSDASAGSLATLPAERIQFIRCRLATETGKEVLDNIQLDLRDIGSDRETLWELQAQMGEQSLRGHGRLDFRQNEIATGFGKLKLSQVSVSTLQPFAPAMLAEWFGNADNQVSGTLTMDITGRHAWAIFGEMELQSSRYEEPLKLRGKISHPDDNHVDWHDSFIHFDDKTAIAINGQCEKSRCESSIKGNNVPLSAWLPLLPEKIGDAWKLAAKTDINGLVQWQPSAWQASAGLKLRKLSYIKDKIRITIPDISIEQAQAKGTKSSWQIDGSTSFAGSDDALGFAIKGSVGKSTARLQSDHLGKIWPTLGNIMLAEWNFEPSLKGDGFISGSIELGRKGAERSLQLDLNADQAGMLHTVFSKPPSTAAACRASISWLHAGDRIPASAILDQCRLHTSHVEKMKWKYGDQTYRMSNKGMHVDFDALQKQGIKLPGILQSFHGQLSGDFSTRWAKADDAEWPWVTHASASLNLQGLGTRDWETSGPMQAEGGHFQSSHLHIQGLHGSVDLKGAYNFDHQVGKLDVLTGSLDWLDMPSLPEGWASVRISGAIQQGHIKLLGNQWQDIQGQYELANGELQLRKFRGNLAKGVITSNLLKLIPMQDGLKVQGKLRANSIHLRELESQSSWLQGELSGTLHANLQLDGLLPATRLADWQFSNGDILIYDGRWSPLPKTLSITEKLGLSTPVAQTYAFRKLEGRFLIRDERLLATSIKLKLGDQLFSGKSGISASGDIHGTLSDGGSSVFRLQGVWPQLKWSAVP